MKKAIASETILTVGVLIAVGVTMLQLRGVFIGQQRIGQKEVVDTFAEDIEGIIDKAIATTGDTYFVYIPPIIRYKVEIEDNMITVLNKKNNKTSSFFKTNIHLNPTVIEDAEFIHIVKVDNTITILSKCKSIGEECTSSHLCCSDSKYCWGTPFTCHDTCANIGEYAADERACCSGYLNEEGRCDNPPISRSTTTTTLPTTSCPSDSPCTKVWPEHQGQLAYYFNEKNYACDLFEVCYQGLDYIIDEARDCCSNACKNTNCHSICKQSYEYSHLDDEYNENNLKKCVGLYIIYGLGPAAKFMRGYFSPEVCCYCGIYDCKRTWNCLPSDLGKCQGQYFVHFGNTGKLSCSKITYLYPRGWSDDHDMTKNKCLWSDLPAHVNILSDVGIHTGTCVDYSVSVTTLLRKAGYSINEVYSVSGPHHAFNLVKFPGEKKWHIIDTTGNMEPFNQLGLPKRCYSYDNGKCISHCDYDVNTCANDGGWHVCPDKDEVMGCS